MDGEFKDDSGDRVRDCDLLGLGKGGDYGRLFGGDRHSR